MKKRILIVDDDLQATRLLKMALEKTGEFDVQEEHQGLRAVAAVEQFHPDILLLDVCMPDLDGGEVAFQLRKHPRLKFLPIIFLTSLVSKLDSTSSLGFRGSGFQYLPKTVALDDLRHCIQKALATPPTSVPPSEWSQLNRAAAVELDLPE